MGCTLNSIPQDIRLKSLTHIVADDDFNYFVTADNFTTVASDGGACAVSDGAKGILAITASDGTVADNDETYLKGTKEVLLFAANRAIDFEASVQFTEANTDDANIVVGYANAVAANHLIDDGGGLVASFSGAGIYKIDGGTVWRCKSSIGATSTDTVSQHTAGGSSYQRLRIEFRAITSTTGEISFLLDGKQMLDANDVPIKHTIDFTSATEMQLWFGVKNGGANAETLNVDYVTCIQSR